MKKSNSDNVGLMLFSLIIIIIGIAVSNIEPSEEQMEEDKLEVEQEDARFTTEPYENNEDTFQEIEILTDNETGCQYIINGGSKYTSGMSPLLDEYGKPTGCRKVDVDE